MQEKTKKRIIKIVPLCYGLVNVFANIFGVVVSSAFSHPSMTPDFMNEWLNFLENAPSFVVNSQYLSFIVPVVLCVLYTHTSKNKLESHFINLPIAYSAIGIVGWLIYFLEQFIYLIFAVKVGYNIDIAKVMFVSGMHIMLSTISTFALVYFILESFHRAVVLPLCFPQGQLSKKQGIAKPSVKLLFIVNYVSVTLFPVVFLLILYIVTANKYSIQLEKSTLIIFVAILVLGIVINFFFGIQFEKPLEKFKERIKKLNNGDFESKVKIIRNDIFGELSDSFNEMTDSILEKAYLKTAFKQYLSPVVIEELIAHPEHLKLGGERREISIFFSDVENFTSISEKLSPEDLTSLLNDYLSAMSDIILEYGGTIDKYEGDAIIAFWNAPLKQENHAKLALEASLKCQKILANMQPTLSKRAGCNMHMRIGLNTGIAVVGNMGSRNRFDYTMLGDAVNLAARLESQNKQFGTYTMCTKAMKDAAIKFGCTKYFRELARIVVVGKKEPVTVFEPLEQSEYEAIKEYISTFNEARNLFYLGEVKKAMLLFEKIQHKDKPAYFYAKKCEKLLLEGQNSFGKGIWVSDTK